MSKEKLIEVKINGKTYHINEGLWSKVKAFIAQAGSLEKGGKIFGRSSQSKAALDQITAVLEKEGNKLIKALDTSLKKSIPKFPNNEDETLFLRGIADIAAVYDSAVGQFNKGLVDAASTNAVITDLRRYTEKLMDYDLADIYKHMREGDEKLYKNWTLDFMQTNVNHFDKEVLNELFGKSKWEKMSAAFDKQQAGQKPAAPGAEGPLTGKGTSTSWKGLESNLLPALLALGGGAAMLAASPWFQSLFQASPGTPAKPGDIIKATKAAEVALQQGDGMTQFTQMVMKTPMDAAQPGSAFLGAGNTLGFSKADPGPWLKMAANPTAMKQAWSTIDWSQNLGTIFTANPKAFFLKKGATMLVGPVTKAIAGAAGGGAVAGTGVLGGLAASGALATIGWSLIGGAVAIKLLRMKGKKYSRLAALKRLMNSMVDVVPKSKPEQAVIQGLTSTGVIKPAEAPADEKKPEEAAESLCLDDEEQKTVRSLFANLPKQDPKVRAKSILRILNVLMNKQRFSKDAQKQFLQEALRDLLRSKILSELVAPTPKKDKTKPVGPGVIPKEPTDEPGEEKGDEEVTKEDCAPVPVGVQRTIMGLFRDARKGDIGTGQSEVDRIVDLLEKYKVLDPLSGETTVEEPGARLKKDWVYDYTSTSGKEYPVEVMKEPSKDGDEVIVKRVDPETCSPAGHGTQKTGFSTETDNLGEPSDVCQPGEEVTEFAPGETYEYTGKDDTKQLISLVGMSKDGKMAKVKKIKDGKPSGAGFLVAKEKLRKPAKKGKKLQEQKVFGIWQKYAGILKGNK
ncbi:MAG: hypothetical protein CMB80_28525 [Flammeovirgaceae bacterium]|nr:hypothetical protein [Flammeovirgaceae bacterium]